MKRITDRQQIAVEAEPGDIVWFKADVEQQGRIVKLDWPRWGGGVRLVLEPVNDRHAFSGDYIGGQSSYTISATDCFELIKEEG